MKKTILTITICALVAGTAVQAQKTGKAPKKPTTTTTPMSNRTLNSEIDTLSYAWGVAFVQQVLATDLKQMQIMADSASSVETVKQDMFLKGFKENFNSNKNPFLEEAYLQGLATGMRMGNAIDIFPSQIAGDPKAKLNIDLFVQGFEAAVKNQPSRVDKALDMINERYNRNMQQQQQATEASAAIDYADNLEAGKAFLAENAKNPDVTTLPDGLQYKVLVQGDGKKPTSQDRVRVHYEGTLVDGTVFDSSYERGESIVFGVTQVIAGWTEALQLMPVGSTWMLYIPYNLAYGTRDMGNIKPFSTLIFKVELLGIE